MKSKVWITLIILILFSSIAIASIDKVAVYNPFGRHLQWLSTGINGALTKDIIWEATGTTTTVAANCSGTTNLTTLGTINVTYNLTALKFPSTGVLIIGTEAIMYSGFTVNSNLSANNVTTVTMTKRAAYGTSNASHTAADNVYFTRYLIGTDNSTAPWFSINSNGYSGFGTVVSGSAGETNWTSLKGYPSACPEGSAITSLGDSVTCTALLVNQSQILQLQSNTTVMVCNATTNVGSIYYDGGDNKHKGCNTTDWNDLY